ncbi:Contactin-associated protein like 5-2 [Tupaia chinensis]|uniref:Contactin-associated protein like 5-2 n=1 Tax=Tupaia chinensis TaxID=246437 RepID=L9KMV1_TUPCH|nr:Contactin-associated protein like 5-2 [Tupaia chinensis]
MCAIFLHNILPLNLLQENIGLDSEVAKANTLGFVGCLSSVQYNHIAPLKAALRHATIAPVTVQGTLTASSCGSMMDSDVNAVTTVHSSSENIGLDSEVAKANTLGFVGCLSSVQYNHIAPLKAALRHATIAPVTVQGTLTASSCGSMMDSDVNAVTTVHSSSGVIAVVIFIIFCIIGIMTRFLYQQKQSHRTNQMKEKDYPENLDSSFRNDIDLQNTVSECKREYFI